MHSNAKNEHLLEIKSCHTIATYVYLSLFSSPHCIQEIGQLYSVTQQLVVQANLLLTVAAFHSIVEASVRGFRTEFTQTHQQQWQRTISKHTNMSVHLLYSTYNNSSSLILMMIFHHLSFWESGRPWLVCRYHMGFKQALYTFRIECARNVAQRV